MQKKGIDDMCFIYISLLILVSVAKMYYIRFLSICHNITCKVLQASVLMLALRGHLCLVQVMTRWRRTLRICRLQE